MLIHTGSRAWYETVRLAVRNRRKRENLRAKEAEHAQGCVEGPLLSVKLAFPSAGARGFAPRIALNERTTAVLLKTSSFLAIYNLRRRRCPAFSPGNHSLPVYRTLIHPWHRRVDYGGRSEYKNVYQVTSNRSFRWNEAEMDCHICLVNLIFVNTCL